MEERNFKITDEQKLAIEQVKQALINAHKAGLDYYYAIDVNCIAFANVKGWKESVLVEDHVDGDGWTEVPTSEMDYIDLAYDGEFYALCVK